MDDCIFCKMSGGEIPVNKICENNDFFSILDQNQDIKGHALIISKKHFETILDTPSSLGGELLNCIKKTFLELMKDYGVEGFNVLNNNFEVAGQVVKHLHVHIYPRIEGDEVGGFG